MIPHLARSVLCLLVLAVIAPSASWGDVDEPMPPVESAILELQRSGDTPALEGLLFHSDHLKMRPGSKTGENRPVVTVTGRFRRQDWSLIVGTDHITANEDGDFSLEIPIESSTTSLNVIEVDLHGKQEEEKYLLNFPNWKLFSGNARIREGRKNFVSFTLGIAGISYHDDLATSVAMLGLDVALSYRRLIWAPYIDFRVIANSIAQPIIATGGMGFRTLGVNALAGFVSPYPREPWRIGLLAGYYYFTMFVPGNAFGFSGAAGPELYPVIQRYFNSGDLLSIYGKYSPVSDGFKFLPGGSNREIAGGVSYAFHTANGSFWKVSFDYAYLQLQIDGINVYAQTFALSASYDLAFALGKY